MSVQDQLNQVDAYRRQQTSRAARQAPPIDIEPEDPSSWPYGDESGPPYVDSMRHEPRQRPSADDLTLAAMTVGPHEAVCPQCWTVHRPEVECR